MWLDDINTGMLIMLHERFDEVWYQHCVCSLCILKHALADWHIHSRHLGAPLSNVLTSPTLYRLSIFPTLRPWSIWTHVGHMLTWTYMNIHEANFSETPRTAGQKCISQCVRAIICDGVQRVHDITSLQGADWPWLASQSYIRHVSGYIHHTSIILLESTRQTAARKINLPKNCWNMLKLRSLPLVLLIFWPFSSLTKPCK